MHCQTCTNPILANLLLQTVFSFISSISSDKGSKNKNASSALEDAYGLVAGRFELSNYNNFVSDFIKVIEFEKPTSN